MTTPIATPATPYVARTRKQVQAAEMADQAAVLARWKGLLPDAGTTWPKVPQEELLLVRGNVHKLAGVVQLRYKLSRQDADSQVKSFMESHP
ncbi:MAG: hypothetical protein ACT4PZ_17565 [Panacagrimonas sp.]